MAEQKLIFGGIINPLFDDLTYNTSGHFARCSYFSSPLRGSEKYYATRKISARISMGNQMVTSEIRK